MKIPNYDPKRPAFSARRFLENREHEGRPCSVIGPSKLGRTSEDNPRFALEVSSSGSWHPETVWTGYLDLETRDLVTTDYSVLPPKRTTPKAKSESFGVTIPAEHMDVLGWVVATLSGRPRTIRGKRYEPGTERQRHLLLGLVREGAEP